MLRVIYGNKSEVLICCSVVVLSLRVCPSSYKEEKNVKAEKGIHSFVNTNTCTTSTSQVKIYLKSSKKLLHVSVFDHLQGVTMSSVNSILLLTTVGCFYAKSGDVAACRVVCIGLYLKSA